MAEFTAPMACDTCGGTDLEPWLRRSDRLDVLQCRSCGLGVVERLPPNLDELYSSDYYDTDESTGRGYGDYNYTAEHSVGWVSPLVELLPLSGGAALDIGCADGLLLSRLPATYTTRAGIEVNPAMVAVCRQRGIDILSTDVLDEGALAARRREFGLVTAMAVFEHVTHFRRAVEIAIDALTDDGLLLFEVPLLVEPGSEGPDNRAWLTSSLEHLFYPTERSLRHLFERVLELPLAGGELYIPGYGSTFVGIASRSTAATASAGAVWDRLRTAATAELRPDERRARAYLHVLHGARSTADDVACLADLRPEDVRPAVLQRLAELWLLDVDRRDHATGGWNELRDHVSRLEPYTADLETVRDDLRRKVADTNAELKSVREAEAQEQLSLRASAEQAKAEAAAAALAAESAATQLHDVLSSTAWRVSAPVRVAGGWKRRVQRLAPAVAGADRRKFRSAVRLVVRRDWETVAQRIRAAEAVHQGSQGHGTQSGRTVERVQAEPWPQDRPLVTVVIPCFNYGAYVDDAISSVIRQTLAERLEVLVVDGGSTDVRTLKRLEELESDPPPRTRVLVRRDGRHMVGDNRNFGISQAQSRYICCLDADDLLQPIYLEVALYLLERWGYDVVSTATQCFGLTEERFGLLPKPVLEDMLLANNVTTVAVYRRDLWVRAGGYHDVGLGSDYVYEDWKLWARFAAFGARIVNIVGEPLFRYRVHSVASLSRQSGSVNDMSRHRDAVHADVAEIVTPESLAESRRRADIEVLVEGGVRNLLPSEPDPRPTVLLAMPFLCVGGAERLLSAVTGHLARTGFRVVITTDVYTDAEFGDATDWFADATVEVYHLHRLLEPHQWGDFVHYLVEAKSVDIVLIAGSAHTYSLLPALTARYPHLAVADLLFNTVGHVENNRRHAERIDLHLCEQAEVEEWLLTQGQPRETVVRVPSGIDTEQYRPVERAPRSGLRVGYSGRLSEEKDPLGFLDIAAATRDDRISFVMTGAGPLEKQVHRRLRSRNPPPVQFLGVVPDVHSHLADLDVLVVPSRLDGRPMVVLEALALGVPVLVSRVGGLPELIEDGVNGMVCAPGDTDAFAARLRQLADDADLLRHLKRGARTSAEQRLDATTMYTAYEKVLRDLVDIARSRGRRQDADSSGAIAR